MGNFNKLPGKDTPVALAVPPELKAQLLRDSYQVIGASICEEHGLGIIIVGAKKTLESTEEGLTLAKCLADSSFTVLREIFADDGNPERVRRASHG